MQRTSLSLLCLLATLVPGATDGSEPIAVRRVPEGGLQPQVAVGDDDVIHLVYYKGAAQAGDLFYVRSEDAGATFSKPLRVNSQPGSAIAAGTIRGAQIALGRDDRVHVAWNGSSQGDSPGGAPMLYTRLREDGTAFELQRNVMTRTVSLDGGGSVAADVEGHVYVVWHARAKDAPQGEDHRAVWVARSSDGGKSFSREIRANEAETGACGCCGLRAFADDDSNLYVLYRMATRVLTRDMRVLVSTDQGKTFAGAKVDAWRVPKCVMSAAAFVEGPRGVLGAWETKGEVYYGLLSPKPISLARRIKAFGSGENRKHPSIAADARGEVLFVWTEGTGWNQGGALAWQLYDAEGSPVAGESGRRDGVPVWSFPAALALSDGKFVIFY